MSKVAPMVRVYATFQQSFDLLPEALTESVQQRRSMSRLSKADTGRIAEAKARVNWVTKPGDHMLDENHRKHYEEVGESAMRIIAACLLLANADPPRSILDFGCGSGRVTRWFKAVYPEALLDVSDVRSDSLEFIQREFGAGAWLSSAQLDTVAAPRKYDLIWSGSVLTHLPEPECANLIGKFVRWLNPGGVAVFTTHGRRAIANMTSKRHRYVPEARADAMRASHDRDGFAFEPFANTPRLGCSLIRLDWLLQRCLSPSVRLVALSEAAWDRHQDVAAIQLSTPDLSMTD